MITDDGRQKMVDERTKLNLCDGNCNECRLMTRVK